MHKTIDAMHARKVAVEAGCEPPSVVKYVKGQPLKVIVVDRIEQALRALNMTSYLRASDDNPAHGQIT